MFSAIGRIQSISDIITNSSSEIFLMNRASTESLHKSFINISNLDTIEQVKENWIASDYLSDHPDISTEDLIGMSIVEIFDDYWEDEEEEFQEASSLARLECTYWISNH